MFEQFALEDTSHSTIVLDAVKWGMAPFHPQTITMWVTESLRFDLNDGRRLIVEVKNLPEDVCRVDLDPIAAETWAWSDSFYQQVAQAVALHFSTIPRIEPPDNCELGEE